MLLATVSQVIVLAALAAEPGISDVSPEVIYTRQTLFSVPFQIDQRVDDPSREPTEVQLYVSGDRGTSWQLYAKENPASRRFNFKAGIDGEFWFMVRTADRAGRLWPQGPETPGLKVAVDTKSPQLTLGVQRGEGGQLTAKWSVDESNLKAESLAIQYRVDDGPEWKSVALETGTLGAASTPQNGQVTWWPQQARRVVEVRAAVQDSAGNPAVSHARVDLPQVGQQRTAAVNPTGQTQRYQTPATNWPSENTNSAPLTGDGLGDRYAVDQPPQNRLETGRYNDASADRYAAPPANASADRYGDRYAQQSVDKVDNQYGDRYGDRYADARQTQPPTETLDNQWQASPARESVAAEVNPPLRNEYAPPTENIAPETPAHADFSTPIGERPRMVNSRVLELQYDVDASGPARVRKVELWGTRDGGRTWNNFATDSDNRSPLVANVDSDGVYGFCVVVQDDTGRGGTPPQSGQLPDVWIGVDTTKPTARITAAEQGVDREADCLTIFWEAEDGKLASRPVTLSFAEGASGPWNKIAAGLDNKGQYTWRFGDRVPQQIYLRMEVRDEAGNVQQVDFDRSVFLSRPQPTVQIRDVRPAGQSARTPARRYHFR